MIVDRVPDKLVDPSLIVLVQVEGVYTRGLLDSGMQVTLFYRDFYDRQHFSLQKLDNLVIWGLGTEKFPYNSYLPLHMTYSPGCGAP